MEVKKLEEKDVEVKKLEEGARRGQGGRGRGCGVEEHTRYVIIWDNVSFHRAALVRNWFTDHTFFMALNLPPYSPFLLLGSDTNLKELNMNNNNLQDSGVKLLCTGLKNIKCKLEILRLRDCDMTDEGCSDVTSALKSNPSHLRELDLSRNNLGDSGVKNLSDLLMNPQFKLEKLHLYRCSITEKQSLILTSALKSNPSHLRDLDLSRNKLGNSGVKNLSDLLMNPQFKLEKLHLFDCGITDVSSLTQSLTNSKALQFLKVLDLRNIEIGDSKQRLRDELRDSNCVLR
ncbi:NACHT, LRR and PYD domains-containing protein [Pimephales promelas]|nr:NACHT, LRR and PYD domains-containing protein [Pimephales promelas]